MAPRRHTERQPRRLAAYLPPHLVAELAAERRASLPRQSRRPATLLLSDVSGFTSLTERLEGKGREGAEEVAAIIEAVFTPVISAVGRRGGSIVSFGGDAIFALFEGERAVARAMGAAEAARASFGRHGALSTSAGAVELGITQAVHHGIVRHLHLGSATRRHYLATGPSVTALARLQASAAAGEIHVSAAARRASGNGGRQPARRSSAAAGIAALFPPPLVPSLGFFDGAYRRVAVLFLETRGFSLRALDAFFRELEAALSQHDGVLLKSDLSAAGTKWLCAFGIPRAHEDDDLRAALTALSMRARVARGLELRGGMCGGVLVNVAFGTPRRRSFDVMGDVVNTAARAVAAARWGDVVAPESVRKGLPGIATEPLGAFAAKGKSRPLELHALVGVRARAPRAYATPFVGRERELRRLAGLVDAARGGRGAAIAIEGDAGIGKSRLAWEASERAARGGFSVHVGRASAFGAAPYQAAGALLRSVIGLHEGPAAAEILASVDEAAARTGLREIDRHHLAEVLGARFPASPLVHLDPAAIALNNRIAIRAFLLSAATLAPRLYLLEDAHLADETTRRAFGFLVRDIAPRRCLLLLLQRPGLEAIEGIETLPLGELDPGDADLLARRLLPAGASAKVAERIRDRAAGNPFYAEELARHVGESHVAGRSEAASALPESVESLIAARLDRLAPEVRRVAERSAVIGRTFEAGLLAHLERDRTVRRAIAELEGRTMIAASREGAEVYEWRHALVRDVAYGTILVARRRRLHREVASAIEELHAAEREAWLPRLAHHWDVAGDVRKAIDAYLLAGRRGAELHAHAEAEAALRRAIALARRGSRELVTARRELAEGVLKATGRTSSALDELREAVAEAGRCGDAALQGQCLAALADVLRIAGRMEESREAHEQAIAALREAGELGSQGAVLASLGKLHLEQGRMDVAGDVLEAALAIAKRARDPRGEAAAVHNLANLRQSMGRPEEARALFEHALATHQALADRKGEGVVLGNLAVLAFHLGRHDDARRSYEQALAIHRSVGDRRAEGITLANLATVAQVTGHDGEAQRFYEEALSIHRDVSNRRSEGVTLGQLGVLRQKAGGMEAARALFHEALGIHREVGARRFEGIVLANLAHLEMSDGRRALARKLFEQALDILAAVGEGRVRAFALGNLARLDLEEGAPARSGERATEALRLFQAVGDPSGAALAHLHLAHLARQSADLEGALRHVREAERLGGSPEEREQIAAERARVEKALARAGAGAPRPPTRGSARARARTS